MKFLYIILCLSMAQSFNVSAADNVVLITLDGLRWQEVFSGLDRRLALSEDYSGLSDKLMDEFWDDSADVRAQKLLPFLHDVVFKKGSYVGNRDQASCAKVSNDWYFSYPGYSEILTGIVNPSINSNAKTPNPERSIFELLNTVPEFKGRSASFASWDVFPFILNTQRSGLHVNAFHKEEDPQSEFELFLNRLLEDTPAPWASVRNDSFTHHYAMSYFKREKPRVLFISYGETDDFAHDGKYDEYIFAANRTDRFIGEIWKMVQETEGYTDNTDLFITVDHGRGEEPAETWRHHASKTSVTSYMSSLASYEEGIVGSDAVWMAGMGPGIPNSKLINTGGNCLSSNRIAATLLELLGQDYRDLQPDMGAPMKEFLR
jgi:hypothetical protein